MIMDKMDVILSTNDGGTELALLMGPTTEFIGNLPPAARFLLACYARANADQAFFEEMMDWGPNNRADFLEGMMEGTHLELVQ